MEKMTRKAIAILTIAALLFALPFITAADDYDDGSDLDVSEALELFDDLVAYEPEEDPEVVPEEEADAYDAYPVEEYEAEDYADEEAIDYPEDLVAAFDDAVPALEEIPEELEELEDLIDELIEIRDRIRDALDALQQFCMKYIPDDIREQYEAAMEELEEVLEELDEFIDWLEGLRDAIIEDLEAGWTMAEIIADIYDVTGVTWDELMDAIREEIELWEEFAEILEYLVDYMYEYDLFCRCDEDNGGGAPTPQQPPTITAPQTGDVSSASTPMLAMMLSLFVLSGGALLKRRTE